MIYAKDVSGIEHWYEYDADGNIIHVKSSDGPECWREYDGKGNLIHTENNTMSGRLDQLVEYAYNNMIHYKDSHSSDSIHISISDA